MPSSTSDRRRTASRWGSSPSSSPSTSSGGIWRHASRRFPQLQLFPVRRRATMRTGGHDADGVFVVDAVRTPVGRIGGALAGVRPDDLAATALTGWLDRGPDLDPAPIDEVYLGDTNGAGEDNRNVARMAVLLAGLPVTIPGATVNRLCGSGLEAVVRRQPGGRRRRRRRGHRRRRRVDVAGAVGAAQAGRALPDRRTEQLWNSALGWRMVNPTMPAQLDGGARRGRRDARRQVRDHPRGAGRVRARLAPARRCGVGRRARSPTRSVAGAEGDRTRPRRVHPRRTRRWSSWRRLQPVVPRRVARSRPATRRR